MQWKGRRASSNVEDRRGKSGGGGLMVGGGLGVGGIVIVIIVMLLGGNPSSILNGVTSTDSGQSQAYQGTAEEEEMADFVSVVLADTEDVWSDVFKQNGKTYRNPTLVLFSGSVQSACGTASSAVGPFYCPGDEKLYIDLSFYDELKQRFKAPGDFAMAYVVAHEVGHHVQKLLGTSQKVDQLRQKLSETEYNKYSVKLELQADYYAGVWAHYEQGKNLLEQGDLDEALTAASAVGDDSIQMQARGYVVPDSFTHGTSEQRKSWFYKGFESGTIQGGDTFQGGL
ncbi:neutral zinc metallopeptidase [Saccharibacillus sp. CPCC 101409]|uniref:KPN_02809 family neutral zinc metallopeptidase n=1 Tax=Saccharibacillus sp. CPCC 101409 TaxID=3058041 RepID=UPI002671D872|nr:neutral zinc metallopeptidase [Saccharibacillus sp. CPCC 101409]MDO3409934.1 neutral zinc metallopeptidase [Saccharibacillus sp. CPCC 101409]